MTPVVYGLQAEYGDRVEFRVLNAAVGEGKTAFGAYGLPGHPGYIILSSSGVELWRAVGPQDANVLREEIDRALQAPGSDSGQSLGWFPEVEDAVRRADRGSGLWDADGGLRRARVAAICARRTNSTGHIWHHRDDVLLEIIASGGGPPNVTGMRGFGQRLSVAEMRSGLEFLKSRWDQDEGEFQWWIAAR